MGASLGVNGKLYRLATGTRATWSATTTDGAKVGPAPSSLDEIPNCKDMSIPLEDAEADVTTRLNGGYEAVIGALRKTGINIAMVYDNADADYAALLKAYLTRGSIALAILDGDKATVGTSGFWADFAILKLEKSEPLTGAQMVTFFAKPTFSAVGPEWVKVSLT